MLCDPQRSSGDGKDYGNRMSVIGNDDSVLNSESGTETGSSCRMAEGDGNSTYRNRIIDAIYNMDKETLDKGAKYEIR